MGKIRQVPDTPVSHPKDLLQVGRVPLWYAFEYNGKRYRVVPLNKRGAEFKYLDPCRGCMLKDKRKKPWVCPGMQVCCAHVREDGESVRFLSDKHTALINDPEMKHMAELADEMKL